MVLAKINKIRRCMQLRREIIMNILIIVGKCNMIIFLTMVRAWEIALNQQDLLKIVPNAGVIKIGAGRMDVMESNV